MQIAMRGACRFAVAGLVGMVGSALTPALGQVATPADRERGAEKERGANWTATPVPRLASAPADRVLPADTVVYIQVADASQFCAAFQASQLGHLLADPALRLLKDDFQAKLDDVNKQVRAQLGLPLEEILKLPQGPIAIAVVPAAGKDAPVAVLAAADAGTNAPKMLDLMNRATAAAREQGKAKVTTEEFQGLTLTIIRPPAEGQQKRPPLIWTQRGTTFLKATDLDALKDYLAHADGRQDALAGVEPFQKIRQKLGTDSQVNWFLNIERALDLVSKGLEAQGGGNAAQLQAQLKLVGLNGLKAAGGGVSVNVGQYDTLSRAFVLTSDKSEGLVKLFVWPKADLRPEPWVPASAASYQTVSWDLDAAYKGLADVADTLAPGVLAGLEQQIFGQQADALKFERDIFGPLGNRISIVSDFKKPVTEQSQRVLFGVALEDAKAFQTTFNKVVELTNAQPKRREFQGTTIYDFDLPQMPNVNNAAAGGGGAKLQGTVSVAIAKGYLFACSDASLVEQILRGGPGLAESPEYQSVARMIPPQASTLSFQRSEENARVLYEMIKSGQLQKAIEQAVKNANRNNAGANAKVPQLIDPAKLPDFAVFAKYLTVGGGYGITEPDGISFTRFTFKKATP